MKLKFFAVLISVLAATAKVVAQEEISLEQVIAMAVERNYDVLLAKVDEEAAKTDKNYSWGAFLPQVNAVGAVTWNHNNQALRFQDATRNNTGKAESDNTTASLQLDWTLFDGTRMFATRERLAAIAGQGELLVKNQMVNTIAQAIVMYYGVVREKQQLKAIQEQMSVGEERVKLAERKLEVGAGIKPELLQARVDYNAQRAQAVQQESTIAQLKAELNALVGLQLPAGFDVADTIIINLNLRPDQLSQNIENTNFSLRATRENIRIADLSLRERRAEYLPFLNFNAAYNYSQTDNTRLINPFSPIYNQSNGYNYGFSVSLPILTGLNTRRLNQQARINVDRQTLLYEQLKTDINVSLNNGYIDYENAKRILLIEEENIGSAREYVDIALESFKRGVTTFIELRTAQQSLAEAYDRLIAARFNAKVAETQLLLLSGALLR